MSGARFIARLLNDADLVWMELGEVITLEKGRQLNKELLSKEGLYPAYNGGISHSGFTDTFNYTENKTIVSQGGASAGFVNFVTSKFYANAHCYVVLPNCERVVDRYVYHLLKMNQESLTGKQHGAGIPALRTSEILEIPIPIPCPDNSKKSLEIQAEIVRILDTFAELSDELSSELSVRKKQYKYYREKLLSFEDGEAEWKTLGDITKKWYSGGTPTAGVPAYYENGTIPWLRTQEVKFSDIQSTEVKITEAALKNSAAKWIPANCVIIAISGATAGRSGINKIPLTTNQHCGCLEIDEKKALYRYVFHWVSFNYEHIKALGQGARGDLNSSIIKGFRLPIPYANDPEKSLAEQARIVAILDKFDTLTNSLSEGLPGEIELRQKQYEYYRELLLSYPMPEEVGA